MAQRMLSLITICFAAIVFKNVSGAGYIPGTFRVSQRAKPSKEHALHPVQFSTGRVLVKGIDVFYQSALSEDRHEPKLPVLLLHAARYSSQTWRDLGTLRFLAVEGYHAIAVDLPGYGKTKKRFSGNKNEFLIQLISGLGIERPILVSPSMSGVYSIPFVLEHSDRLRGYVPIAPTNKGGTSRKFSHVNLPSLIVFGSWDSYGERMSRMIANIPGSRLESIYWASHHAYLDDPDKWHKLLKEFLDALYAKEQAVILFEDDGSAEPGDV